MKPGKRLRGAWLCPLVALLAAFAVVPPPVLAVESRLADDDLSPRLTELVKPSVRAASPEEQAERLSVAPEGPGSLLRDGNRVLVDVRFERGAVAGVDDLRGVGAEVVNVSSRYQTITVAVRPADLREVAAVPRVEGVTENLAPITFASGDPPPATSAGPACPGAGATSEGDAQLRADEAREDFGVDGSGVTVGVLSDSFDQDSAAPSDATDDVESGDLPGPGNLCGYTDEVVVLDDSKTDGSDEGRAMAQIVHDLSPGSELAFATAFSGINGFADNVRKLADPIASGGAEADAIVDDVVYFEEPFFQDGPVAVAVNDVTSEGVTYFSSAGNNNLFDSSGNEIASWEAEEFRDSPGCPAALEELLGAVAEVCVDFDPGPGTDNAFRISIADGGALSVDLQWAEPWYGVHADLDVFLLDSEGQPIEDGSGLVGSFDDNVSESERPFEFFRWENDTGSAQQVQLAINRCFATCNAAASPSAEPRLKFVLFQNGVTGTEYPTSTGGDVTGPTIFGHNGADNAISVGAVRYNDSTTPEPFSSRGPVTHRFGPVSGTVAASPLDSPQVLSKPDLAATDGGANTFFGQSVEGVWRFFGTSAAAPHAAAVSALMLEEDPTAGPEEIRAAMVQGAAGVGGFGPCAVGAGLLDAVAAIELLVSPEGGAGSAGCVPPASAAIPDEEEEDEPDSSDDSSDAVAAPPAAPPAPPPPIVTPDVVAPQTFIRTRPRRVIRTRFRRGRAVFVFHSSERAASFICQFDRKRRRRCGPRFVRWFLPGRHVLRVTTRDAAGNVDPKPAVYRFRVKRVSKQQFARFKRASRHDRR